MSRFKWTSAEENGESSFLGKLQTYPGSGYRVVLPLDHTRAIDEIVIGRLMAHRFIDRATRAVFVDVTLYNPSLDLLALVKVVFEFPAAGSVLPSLSIRLLRLGQMYFRPDTLRAVAIEGGMLFWLLCYVIAEIRKWRRLGSAIYFMDTWSYYEWANFVIFGASYACRFIALKR